MLIHLLDVVIVREGCTNCVEVTLSRDIVTGWVVVYWDIGRKGCDGKVYSVWRTNY